MSNILQNCFIPAYLRLCGGHFPRLVHWAINAVTALVFLFSGIYTTKELIYSIIIARCTFFVFRFSAMCILPFSMQRICTRLLVQRHTENTYKYYFPVEISLDKVAEESCFLTISETKLLCLLCKGS